MLDIIGVDITERDGLRDLGFTSDFEASYSPSANARVRRPQ